MSLSTALLYAPTSASLLLYLGTLGAFFWTMARASRARRVRRAERGGAAPAPRVSVLKPLAGDDDELEANLESFARLTYPDVEILFGVARPSDPAAAVARSFLRRHPELKARLTVTDARAAVNPKVAQLIGLEAEATGAIVVVSDSNVRVEPGYLCALVRELETADLVTSVFAGTGERSLGAALENLQLGAVVLPGIAVSSLVAAAPLTVGKSMAMRRDALHRTGNFAAVGHVLAEDHVLGRRFHDAGLRVRLSLAPVENRNVACSLRRTVERHSRWSKLRRTILPHLFFLEPLMSPLLVATFTATIAPSRATLELVLAVAVLQTVLALLSVRVSRGRSLSWKYAPLEIVRTYLLFGCWVAAAVTTRLAWRGHPFRLLAGSVIVPVNVRETLLADPVVRDAACVPERASSSWFPPSRRRRASAG